MNDQYVLSRRERKKQNCKYAILKAARELIVTQGVDVLIEDIANRADISYPTFYHYFPTKACLFYAIYLEEIEDLQEFADIELPNETSALRRVELLFDALMRDFLRFRYLDLYIAGEAAKHTAESGGEEAILALFLTAIRSGVASGEFRADLDAERYARLILGIVLSASFYGCGEDDCRGMLAILTGSMIKEAGQAGKNKI